MRQEQDVKKSHSEAILSPPSHRFLLLPWSCWLLLSNLLFWDIFIVYISVKSHLPRVRGVGVRVQWNSLWVSWRNKKLRNGKTLKVFFHLDVLSWHQRDLLAFSLFSAKQSSTLTYCKTVLNGLSDRFGLELKAGTKPPTLIRSEGAFHPPAEEHSGSLLANV